MPDSYDVIVIGGGMLGLSCAYHLARQGARILLLQAGDLGGGSSAACSGRAQVAEGHLDPLNIRLILEGLARLETLEEELGTAFEWRRNGFLALINAQHLWDDWVARAEVLTAAGIPTEVLDRAALQEAEPHLNTEGFMGAAYAVEGLLNPFLFCWAYAKAARRYGALLLPQTPVTAMRVRGRRVAAIEAGGEWYEAARVAIMCGAWTPQVARLAGADVPLSHTHAEAFVTEPVSLALNNTIELADFYERIHGRDQAVAVGFSPDLHGGVGGHRSGGQDPRIASQDQLLGHGRHGRRSGQALSRAGWRAGSARLGHSHVVHARRRAAGRLAARAGEPLCGGSLFGDHHRRPGGQRVDGGYDTGREPACGSGVLCAGPVLPDLTGLASGPQVLDRTDRRRDFRRPVRSDSSHGVT